MTTAIVPDDPSTLAESKPTATIVLVTPAMAAGWLEANHHNRNVRARQVHVYAADMRRGAWQITGEAIKFDHNGNVIDGQHRLLAVVEAEVPVLMFVVRGLAPSAQDVMDTGLKRRAGDALGLNGYKNASILAAAVRLAINYESGQIKSAGQKFLGAVTNSDVMDFVALHPSVVESASKAQGSWRNIPTHRSVVAFAHYVLSAIDDEAATQFFQDLAESRTAGNGDPRSTLLRRLHSIKRDKGSEGQITHAHYIFRSWNAMREGKTLGNLKVGNLYGSFDFARPS